MHFSSECCECSGCKFCAPTSISNVFKLNTMSKPCETSAQLSVTLWHRCDVENSDCCWYIYILDEKRSTHYAKVFHSWCIVLQASLSKLVVNDKTVSMVIHLSLRLENSLKASQNLWLALEQWEIRRSHLFVFVTALVWKH